MISARHIASDGKTFVNFRNAENADIITVLHSNIDRATRQVREVAESFRGMSDLATCRNIFNFLKENIRYQADGYNQDIRLPGRFVATATGDCKSYSLFTAAILSNLGIPYCIRYASYTADPTPQHVYIVATPINAKPIIIDAVYGKFNQEKKYTYKQDYTMNVRTLSGIGAAQNPNPFIGSIFKTGALAAPRGAFLLLLKLNVFGYASYLSKVLEKDPNGLKDKWNKLGGNFTELKNAINDGKGKAGIFNKEARINGIGIGSFATVGATLAAAAAIIAQMQGVLDSGKKLFGSLPLPGSAPKPPAPGPSTQQPPAKKEFNVLPIALAAVGALLLLK